jgi:hypothetical protein
MQLLERIEVNQYLLMRNNFQNYAGKKKARQLYLKSSCMLGYAEFFFNVYLRNNFGEDFKLWA